MRKTITPAQIQPLLSAAQLAQILGVHHYTVLKAASGHRDSFDIPPGFKVGCLWKWRPETVDRWIDERAGRADIIPAPVSDDAPGRGRGRPRKVAAAQEGGAA